MSDTPKFTVVDRRKFRDSGDEEPVSPSKPTDSAPAAEAARPAEPETAHESASEARPEAKPATRLTLVEPPAPRTAVAEPPVPGLASAPALIEDPYGPEDDFATENSADITGEYSEEFTDDPDNVQLPPAPTPEEVRLQKLAYDKAAERIDNLVRAQNPAAPAQEKIGLEHLIQQLYLSALMQMGAGTPEGQRPRLDIVAARQTIDLLTVVTEKAQGNLTPQEDRTLETALFELRLNFVELTRMITAQPTGPLPPPPGGAKR